MPSFIAAVFHHWGVAAILHIHYENKFHIYLVRNVKTHFNAESIS